MAIIIVKGDIPPNPNVNYNGGTFPRDKVNYAPPQVDQTNDPSVLIIGGIILPADTVVYIDGMKTNARSQILDGVEVTEHINRKATNIEFDIVIREFGAMASENSTILSATGAPFPQDQLVNFWDTVWRLNTVQKIQHTLINKMGINQIIIDNVNVSTVRGSKNIPIRLTAYENVPGDSLIIANNDQSRFLSFIAAAGIK